MKEGKEIILCDFEICPMKSKCAFYCPTMDKSKTVHYGSYPYEVLKGRCFEEIDVDDIVKKVTDFLNPFKN